MSCLSFQEKHKSEQLQFKITVWFQCLSSGFLLNGDQEMTQDRYKEVCPVLLSQLLPITFQTKVCQVQTLVDEDLVSNDTLAGRVFICILCQIIEF